jgi:hypothetical protein
MARAGDARLQRFLGAPEASSQRPDHDGTGVEPWFHGSTWWVSAGEVELLVDCDDESNAHRHQITCSLKLPIARGGALYYNDSPDGHLEIDGDSVITFDHEGPHLVSISGSALALRR